MPIRYKFSLGSVIIESDYRTGITTQLEGVAGRLQLWKLNLLVIVKDKMFVGVDKSVLEYDKIPDYGDDIRADRVHSIPGTISCLRRVNVSGFGECLLISHEAGGSMILFPDTGKLLPFNSKESTWGGDTNSGSAGDLLAASSNDHLVRIWNMHDNSMITISGHQHNIPHVQFSPDGRYLLSCSIDKTMRVWNAETGKELSCYDDSTSWIWSGHFVQLSSLPQGCRIPDNQVGIWTEGGGDAGEPESHTFLERLEDDLEDRGIFNVPLEERLLEDEHDFGEDGEYEEEYAVSQGDMIESVSLEDIQIWSTPQGQPEHADDPTLTWCIEEEDDNISHPESSISGDSLVSDLSQYKIANAEYSDYELRDIQELADLEQDYLFLVVNNSDISVLRLHHGEFDVLQHRPRLLHTHCHPGRRELFNNPALEWHLNRFQYSLWLPSLSVLLVVNQLGFLAVSHLYRGESEQKYFVEMVSTIVPPVDSPDIEPIMGLDVRWLDGKRTAAHVFILKWSGLLERLILRTIR